MYRPAPWRHCRPIASRSILLAMKTFKTRHQFYLPDDLSAKLDALTASTGTSKTQILTDALNAWLERKGARSEEHKSELQSLMRNSYDVLCLKTKKYTHRRNIYHYDTTSC